MKGNDLVVEAQSIVTKYGKEQLKIKLITVGNATRCQWETKEKNKFDWSHEWMLAAYWAAIMGAMQAVLNILARR